VILVITAMSDFCASDQLELEIGNGEIMERMSALWA
jgi:hypothetical protein